LEEDVPVQHFAAAAGFSFKAQALIIFIGTKVTQYIEQTQGG